MKKSSQHKLLGEEKKQKQQAFGCPGMMQKQEERGWDVCLQPRCKSSHPNEDNCLWPGEPHPEAPPRAQLDLCVRAGNPDTRLAAGADDT